LTEFVKSLGRDGICRVTEEEDGFYVAWIDSSPEAMRRQETLRKKERQDRGDEEREQREIEAQVERAHRQAFSTENDNNKQLERPGGGLISLDFVSKTKTPTESAKSKNIFGEADPEDEPAAEVTDRKRKSGNQGGVTKRLRHAN
jgi:DNA/RNA-binding protein KIN17